MIKSRIFYVIALLALSLFYIYCNSYTPLCIIMLFLVLTVLGIVSVFFVRKKLSAEVCALHPFITQSEDGNAEFFVKLKNNSLFPIAAVTFDLEFRDVSEEGFIKRKIRTPVASKEERHIHTLFTASHAACIECCLGNFRIYDAFGIFSLKLKNISGKSKILVTPVLRNESYRNSSEGVYIYDSDKFSDVQKGDDPSQVFEIRDYIPGDDIRRIHWRLSSKQDSLIVKEYSKPIDDDCMILLETGIGGKVPEAKKKRADAILSVFMTLASELLQNEQSFQVLWYSMKKNGLVSFDVGTFEEITPVIERYLFENLSEKRNATYIVSQTEKGDFFGKSVYYIYNSSCFDKDLCKPQKENYIFIDTKSICK